MRIVVDAPTSRNIVGVNKEKYALHKNGVDVTFTNDKGAQVKKVFVCLISITTKTITF